MANTILLKSSSVAAKIPTTSSLSLRELAINTNDGKLYLRQGSGVAGDNIYTVNPWIQSTGGSSYDLSFTSGNVGIGASPIDALTVLGKIHLQQNSSSTNRFILRGQPSSSYRWNIDNNGASNDFRIFREDDATSANGAVYLNISNSGLVSVSSFRSTGILYDSSGAAGTNGQVLTSTGTGTSWSSAGSGSITVSDDTTTNDTRYLTFTSLTSGSLTTENVSSTKLTFNPSTGLLSATSFSGSGSSLTSLTADNLTGTIPSGVLGNSSLNIGTTSIALNRASANLALTGISSVAMPGSTSGTITLQPAAIAGTNTITLPATTGTIITTGDTGTVTGTMIADGTIADAEISASASIAITKLAASTISGVSLGNNLSSITFNNGGAGDASGTTYNGGTARTISYNSIGASPLAGSSSLTTTGSVTSGTWSSGLSGETFSTTNNVIAGTNAQGQGALTSDYNIITTASNNPSGVTLPVATQGRRIIIVNRGANPVNVYPATGGAIDALGSNISISLAVGAILEFDASSTTQWYSNTNIALNASQISTGTVPTARLGSGTANSTTYLRGDSTWATVTSGINVVDDTTTNATRYVVFEDVTSGSSSSVGTSSTKLTFNPSTGTLSATIFSSLSDASLKENIQQIKNATDIIKNLRGVRYDWIDGEKNQIGVIAQEIEKVIPEVVKEADGVKSVAYSNIVALLIEAIKEQQIKIENLEKKINA